MMASQIEGLIQRAQDAVGRFDHHARKPIVVEFAGCPKAGKTSTIGQVAAFFKRTGFKVEVVVERASVCPIRDKKHSNFNVWTGCTTLANLLEKTQDPPRSDDPQLLILDRGLFDSVCWLRMMERLARVRKDDRERIEAFLLIDDWRKRLSGVVMMLASPEDSMEREKGSLPVPGSAGSIMNPEVLKQMRTINEEVAQTLQSQFQIKTIDTSAKRYNKKPKETCEAVAEVILGWIEEHIAEHIYFVPRSLIDECFGNRSSLDATGAKKVVEAFSASGDFLPRNEVEPNADYVQAIPVAIVRNASGDVLRLKRKEKDLKNPLHEKIVLWAGGHVRKEDAVNGDTLKQALVRELHEELRLDVSKDKLRLIGAVYTRSNDRSAKHVAIVHEWRAETDDVAVSLSSAEFYERRGTAVSGTFVSIKELQESIQNPLIDEAWTAEIVQRILPETAKKMAALF